jgi:hypothetical protein
MFEIDQSIIESVFTVKIKSFSQKLLPKLS